MIDKAKSIIEKLRVWGVPGIIGFIRRKYVFAVQRRRLASIATKSKIKNPVQGITVIGELTAQVSLSKTMRDFIFSLK